MGVECIILAAGFGNRFGGNKLLAELPSGNTVLSETVSVYQNVFENIAIVCRPEQIKIFSSAISSAAKLKFIPNEKAKQGMSQSIRAGISSVDCDKGWLIALADMPFVQVATIESIVQKVENKEIVRPIYNDKIGNPVYISIAYKNELQQIDGDRGARRLIERADQNDVLNLTVDDPGVLRDIDTIDDIPSYTIK